ncbi:hypothetical protein X777_01040 [Ooceraea biroi]|uniref:Uncharacterized protein n=1 Tax=Ooceraea biroi TaxID=2015173 RepID=A0A026VT15_OOCBI|nr:hypothetical protein X777_01040 [Ooceraea biroi]
MSAYLPAPLRVAQSKPQSTRKFTTDLDEREGTRTRAILSRDNRVSRWFGGSARWLRNHREPPSYPGRRYPRTHNAMTRYTAKKLFLYLLVCVCMCV